MEISVGSIQLASLIDKTKVLLEQERTKRCRIQANKEVQIEQEQTKRHQTNADKEVYIAELQLSLLKFSAEIESRYYELSCNMQLRQEALAVLKDAMSYAQRENDSRLASDLSHQIVAVVQLPMTASAQGSSMGQLRSLGNSERSVVKHPRLFG